MIALYNERRKITFQSDLVTLQTLHSLLEECLARRGHTGNIVLLPLDGSVDMVKDFLHRVCDLCANTITWNEGDLDGESAMVTKQI